MNIVIRPEPASCSARGLSRRYVPATGLAGGVAPVSSQDNPRPGNLDRGIIRGVMLQQHLARRSAT